MTIFPPSHYVREIPPTLKKKELIRRFVLHFHFRHQQHENISRLKLSSFPCDLGDRIMTPKCSYSGVTEEKLRAMQLVCSGDDLEGDARRIRFLFLTTRVKKSFRTGFVQLLQFFLYIVRILIDRQLFTFYSEWETAWLVTTALM